MKFMENMMITDVIGALCQDDYKGINNQYIDQGKVVLCLRNTNSAIGENATPQVHSGHTKVHMGGSENIVTDKKYAVRRLTPTECERLQSLPDGWTKIPHRSCSDSARYKALGNGMAQCCPTWLLKRLVKAVEECEE